MIKTSKISRNRLKFRLNGIFLSIPRNLSEHSPESAGTFPGILWNIPRNLLEHSPESSRAFPGIFSSYPGIFNNIPWNLLEHSPESLITLPWILSNIPWNLFEHSRNAKMRTFPGIVVNIPRVPYITRILCHIPGFLVLQIAIDFQNFLFRERLLLNLFSCLINSFIIIDVCENLKENVNIK